MSRIKEQVMLIETKLFGPLNQAGMYQGFDETVHINGKKIGPKYQEIFGFFYNNDIHNVFAVGN
jgi:hypothetical protein